MVIKNVPSMMLSTLCASHDHLPRRPLRLRSLGLDPHSPVHLVEIPSGMGPEVRDGSDARYNVSVLFDRLVDGETLSRCNHCGIPRKIKGGLCSKCITKKIWEYKDEQVLLKDWHPEFCPSCLAKKAWGIWPHNTCTTWEWCKCACRKVGALV